MKIKLLIGLVLLVTFIQDSIAVELIGEVSDPRRITKIDEKFYFPAEHARLRTELFVSDGTEFSNRIITNSRGTVDFVLTKVGQDILYLFSPDAFEGPAENRIIELRKLNGDTSELITNFPTSGARDLISVVGVVNAEMFFVLTPPSSGSPKLYATNGTKQGTREISANLRRSGGNSAASTFIVQNNAIYYLSRDLLYRVNPQSNSSTLIYDGLPYNDNGVTFDGETYITERLFSNQIVIQARQEVWLSDGTPDGTRMVRPLAGNPGINKVSVVNDKLIIADNSNRLIDASGNQDIELATDVLTSSGENIIGYPIITESAVVYRSVDRNSRVISGGEVDNTVSVEGLRQVRIYGDEIVGLRRESESTTEVIKFNMGSITPQTFLIQDDGDQVLNRGGSEQGFFIEIRNASGATLFVTPKNSSSLALVREFSLGTVVNDFYNISGRAFFTTRTPRVAGEILWATDGTAQGTYSLKYTYMGIEEEEPTQPPLSPLLSPIYMLLFESEK